jgi:hypothetical protein
MRFPCDVLARRVTVHRSPQGGMYTSISTPSEGGPALHVDAFPTITFPVAAIFE